MECSTQGLPVHHQLPEFKCMSIESVMPSNHLILCCPLLLLPSIFPSIRVFSNESALRIRWPKYWNISFNISPSNEHPGLISFRMDWFDLLAVQGTLKSLLQCHSSKASILWCSALFMVQLTSIHDYWKAIVFSHFIRVGTLTTKVSSNQKFSYHVRTQSWGSESGTQAYRQSTSLRLHIIQFQIWIKLFMNCQHHCQVVKAKNILSLNTKSTVYNE